MRSTGAPTIASVGVASAKSAGIVFITVDVAPPCVSVKATG
ncbi:MAG TPA: hypothetical protein VFQ65_02295 [Kofleriaceae bacterium]|nr:hypothetical protein [Kofleriaceae bacterium]